MSPPVSSEATGPRGQVVLVGLDDALETLQGLFGERALLHPVEDLEEGFEMASLVKADVLCVNPADFAPNPLESISGHTAAMGAQVRAMLLVEPTLTGGLSFIQRDPVTGDLQVSPISPKALSGIITDAAGEDDAVPKTSKELRQIGFNESVERCGRCFMIQTEVICRDGITIRSAVFEEGRRLSTREVSMQDEDPAGSLVEGTALRVHRESVDALFDESTLK